MNKTSHSKNWNIQVLRGIAILMVAIYHFTYRWSSNFSYQQIVENDYLKIFIMGVQLFFIISGYIIFKTIENTRNLRIFISKRVQRLIPTLIIVIPVLYLFQKIIKIKNFPELNFFDVPVSIAILNPTYTAFFFHVKTNFVTGVMWTLTYEITFYTIVGIVYFLFSKKNTLQIFVILLNTILILNYCYLYLSGNLGNGFSNPYPNYPSIQYLIQQSGVLHLSWFGLGMWFYKFEGRKLNKEAKLIFANLLFLVLYDAVGGTSIIDHFEVSLLFAFMTLCFVLFFIQNLRGKLLLPQKYGNIFARLGDVSYEFYLIHEVLGVAILSFLSFIGIFANNNQFVFFLVPLTIYLLFLISIRVQTITSSIFTK